MIAQQVLTKLKLLGAREDCVKAFKPFICLLLFGLCNGSGQVMKPSYEECVSIKNESCAQEVKLAMDDPSTVELFPACNDITTSCGELLVSFPGPLLERLLRATPVASSKVTYQHRAWRRAWE